MFIVLFCCCQSENNTQTVDIKNAELVNIESLVSDISCIPLEEGKQSFFRACRKIIAYKSYLYLYSMSDFAVYIFSSDGHFVGKIDATGKKGVTFPTSIFVDETKGELWVPEDRHLINKYTLEGILIEQIKLSYPIVDLADVGDGYYLFYNGRFDKNATGYIRLSRLDDLNNFVFYIDVMKGKKLNAHIPMSLFAQDVANDKTYMLLPMQNTLFMFDNATKTLIPFLSLDFGSEFMSEENYPVEGYTDKEMAEIILQRKYTYNVHSFHWVAGKFFLGSLGFLQAYYIVSPLTGKVCRFETLFDGIPLDYFTSSIQGSTTDELLLVVDSSKLRQCYQSRQIESSYPAINAFLADMNSHSGYIVLKIKLKNEETK